MSIVITCNLSDGVLIGTDSAITIQGSVKGPDGIVQNGVLKIYNNTEKLFQLEELPVAVATCGIGMLGERSIGSYVKEFEFSLKNENIKLETQNVEQISEAIRCFFLDKYKEVLGPALEKELGLKFDDIPDDKKPILELIVAGFSPNEYLSEVWHILIPIADKSVGLRCTRKKGEFGTNWFGITEPIFRMIKGYDRNIPNQLIDYLVKTHKINFNEADKVAIEGILGGFEYRIPYGAMPIQEGANHVKFLLDLVINQTKYVIGAEVCGSPVKIGVVQRGEKEFRIITDNKINISN